MIVLDTNVLSELMKSSPAEPVLEWMARMSATSLYTTSITQAEILYGILLLPAGKRRSAIVAAAEVMFNEDFSDRILAFNSAAALSYAEIAAARHRAGLPISSFDAQLAAIARSTGAAIATRNVKDFDACGIRIEDPWNG